MVSPSRENHGWLSELDMMWLGDFAGTNTGDSIDG